MASDRLLSVNVELTGIEAAKRKLVEIERRAVASQRPITLQVGTRLTTDRDGYRFIFGDFWRRLCRQVKADLRRMRKQ